VLSNCMLNSAGEGVIGVLLKSVCTLYIVAAVVVLDIVNTEEVVGAGEGSRVVGVIRALL